MEWKPQSNLYKLHLSRITQQLQKKLRIGNNVQILLENMLLNPSTTKYITVPFRDILQSRPITEMLCWNNALLISQIIYLLSPTWKWNSNTMFQSSYFNIAKKYCDMWYADCYIFLTSDFNSPVNHSVHIKAACWLMLEFYLYFGYKTTMYKSFTHIQRLILLVIIIAMVWKPTRHYMHWRFSKNYMFIISLNQLVTLICISPQTKKVTNNYKRF